MSGKPLRLQLRASPALTLLTVATHGLAAAVVWFSLPAAPGLLIVILVCVLAALAVRQKTLLRGATAPAVLELQRDGNLCIQLRDGARFEGMPADRRYVSRWLVIIEMVRAPVARRTLLIARDMLSPAEFRHLRLWALWRALPDAPPVAGA